MPPLPSLSSPEVETILERAGFVLVRRSGHRVWQKGERIVPVPRHPGDIPKGTLRSIIRLSGLTVDEFLAHR